MTLKPFIFVQIVFPSRESYTKPLEIFPTLDKAVLYNIIITIVFIKTRLSYGLFGNIMSHI